MGGLCVCVYVCMCHYCKPLYHFLLLRYGACASFVFCVTLLAFPGMLINIDTNVMPADWFAILIIVSIIKSTKRSVIVSEKVNPKVAGPCAHAIWFEIRQICKKIGRKKSHLGDL